MIDQGPVLGVIFAHGQAPGEYEIKESDELSFWNRKMQTCLVLCYLRFEVYKNVSTTLNESCG